MDRWNGPVKWTGGMDRWNGPVEWTGGMDRWNGVKSSDIGREGLASQTGMYSLKWMDESYKLIREPVQSHT